MNIIAAAIEGREDESILLSHADERMLTARLIKRLWKTWNDSRNESENGLIGGDDPLELFVVFLKQYGYNEAVPTHGKVILK